MRKFAITVLATALTLPAQAAAKADPAIPLARVSKWEMNYSPDNCQLMARFGTGEDSLLLAISREQPGDEFDIHLYGQTLKYDGIAVPIELSFGASGATKRYEGLALTTGGEVKLPVVRITGLRIDGWDDVRHPERAPEVTRANEAAITAITFKKAGGKRYRLEAGSLGPPLAAMRTCVADLLKTWGYDPAVEGSLTRRAMPATKPSTWAKGADFPPSALNQGHNGLVRFRLDIDPAGLPTTCTVLYRTNPDDFADRSCKLLIERARFSPALDASGKPVKSYYINSIRWVAGGW